MISSLALIISSALENKIVLFSNFLLLQQLHSKTFKKFKNLFRIRTNLLSVCSFFSKSFLISLMCMEILAVSLIFQGCFLVEVLINVFI